MDAVSGFGVLSSSLNHGCFGIERAGAIGLRRKHAREIELWRPCSGTKKGSPKAPQKHYQLNSVRR
jgi:hypothetical protein